MLFNWCHVTPLTFALTGFLGCVAFAGLTFGLLDRLPNWSWRAIILTVAFASIAIHLAAATARHAWTCKIALLRVCRGGARLATPQRQRTIPRRHLHGANPRR